MKTAESPLALGLSTYCGRELQELPALHGLFSEPAIPHSFGKFPPTPATG
jgi:hypothetical protein